jgi:RecA-family ATPase
MDIVKALADLEELENPNGNHGTPRFIVRNAADALKPQPPIEYIVDRLITSSSVNVFFGEPGSKKTYSLLSLAVCAAVGKTWLEFAIPAPIKVLVVDEESGERRLTVRLGACIRGERATNIDPEYLSYVSLAGFDLGEDKDVLEVSKLIMDVGAQLVIIDALADIMSGDENSKQETQPVLNHLRKIAENTDSAIVLIHHSNKMGMYRGTSAIKGSVDLMVKVESDNDSKFINFTTEKNRDGEPLKWSAEATWANNEDGEQFYLSGAEARKDKEVLTKSKVHVLQYLFQSGTSSLDDICAAAAICSTGAARQAIYAMTAGDKPYTKRTDTGTSGGRGQKAFYDLTEEGRKIAETV